MTNLIKIFLYTGDLRIQVHATVHLPSSTNNCTFNITTTTTTTKAINGTEEQRQQQQQLSSIRTRNNLNGGGIVNLGENNDNTMSIDRNEQLQQQQIHQPITPVSWLTPCPWGFVTPTNSYLLEKDLTKLAEVRKLLQSCGWYYEGISWQQSENLLKDEPVGRWLMRDSSDSR